MTVNATTMCTTVSSDIFCDIYFINFGIISTFLKSQGSTHAVYKASGIGINHGFQCSNI